jgi:WhiB family transcriptional regulator, redox-sensing transcriptional regulator
MTRDRYVAESKHWKPRAACRGLPVEIFFPEHGDSIAAARAKAICRTCPVTAECLDYAHALHMRAGIWGGRSIERDRFRRRTAA